MLLKITLTEATHDGAKFYDSLKIDGGAVIDDIQTRVKSSDSVGD